MAETKLMLPFVVAATDQQCAVVERVYYFATDEVLEAVEHIELDTPSRSFTNLEDHKVWAAEAVKVYQHVQGILRDAKIVLHSDFIPLPGGGSRMATIALNTVPLKSWLPQESSGEAGTAQEEKVTVVRNRHSEPHERLMTILAPSRPLPWTSPEIWVIHGRIQFRTRIISA